MIFNENAMPLMIKYQAAREVEATATQALLAAMEQKLATDIISELSDRMEDAHKKSMGIWDDLQQHKIGE